MAISDKLYAFKFGTGKASDNTGLSPTLLTFSERGISSIAAPGVTETPAGSGIYQFQFSISTVPIVVEIDGGGALSANDRYLYTVLDPLQYVDQQVGTPEDSFGSTSTDPTTVFGHAKRNQEWLEGNATFAKGSGTWQVSSRGSSTLLGEKTLTNDTTSATKS